MLQTWTPRRGHGNARVVGVGGDGDLFEAADRNGDDDTIALVMLVR